MDLTGRCFWAVTGRRLTGTSGAEGQDAAPQGAATGQAETWRSTRRVQGLPVGGGSVEEEHTCRGQRSAGGEEPGERLLRSQRAWISCTVVLRQDQWDGGAHSKRGLVPEVAVGTRGSSVSISSRALGRGEG